MFADVVALYVLLAFILLLIGAFAGWFFATRGKAITTQRLRTGVAIVITLVWVVTIIAEIIVPGYTVAMFVHAIMGAVVGYLFSENGLKDVLNTKEE